MCIANSRILARALSLVAPSFRIISNACCGVVAIRMTSYTHTLTKGTPPYRRSLGKHRLIQNEYGSSICFKSLSVSLSLARSLSLSLSLSLSRSLRSHSTFMEFMLTCVILMNYTIPKRCRRIGGRKGVIACSLFFRRWVFPRYRRFHQPGARR